MTTGKLFDLERRLGSIPINAHANIRQAPQGPLLAGSHCYLSVLAVMKRQLLGVRAARRRFGRSRPRNNLSQMNSPGQTKAAPGRSHSKELDLIVALETFQYALRHHLPVDLIRPIVNSRAALTVEHLQWGVLGITERAMDLNRSVDHICKTRAPKLISEISIRASSPRSNFQAAFSVIKRAALISAAESAIQFCTLCFFANGSPNDCRWSA